MEVCKGLYSLHSQGSWRFSHKWRGGGGGGRPAGGRREKKGNASHQTAVKRENFWHTIMQTTRIIIVKQKLNYVKHEVTMTDYDSMQSRGQNFSKSVILKLFCQSCAAEQSNICGTAMFYFNADNAAARKPRDRRSTSWSSIPDLQWFN